MRGGRGDVLVVAGSVRVELEIPILRILRGQGGSALDVWNSVQEHLLWNYGSVTFSYARCRMQTWES
jgi:hypothetical protein